MKYLDFVDLNHKPENSDVICVFHVEPQGMSIEEAAGAVAAESSIGTWTELTTTKSYVEKLAAHVVSIDGNTVKVAYPIGLFEPGNMSNILSSISGNVFGLKTIKNLRFEDADFPQEIARSFKGPKFGVEGVRNLLEVYDRPLVGTIIKPKLGLKTADHAQVAYEA